MVLERDRLITQTLLDRMSAYSGSIFLVTDLHRCAVALGAQRPTSVLVLAGKPPESRWTDWRAQVQSATHASCPMMAVAVDLPKDSAAPSFLTFQGLQGTVDLGDASVDVLRHIQAWIERVGTTTLAYGPLHLDRSQKTLSAAGRSVALKDALFDLLLLFWSHPQRILPMELLQKVLASAGSALVREAHMAIRDLRSRLHYLGFDDCIINIRDRGYLFTPPDISVCGRRMAARPTGRNPLLTKHPFSAPRFDTAAF